MVVVMALSSVGSAKSTIRVEAMTIDELSVRNLSCQIDNGGFMAVMQVVGTLSKQKKALDACAPGGAAVRAKWTWSGGKATTVQVTQSSRPEAARCVEKALKLTESALVGDCQAMILIGEGKAAATAADALPK